MSTRRRDWRPRAMPAGIVGAKVSVYRSLVALSRDQGDHPDAAPGLAYFRRTTLAQKARVSPVHVSAVLKWLHEEGFITYRPGGPGRLSSAQVATGDSAAQSGQEVGGGA